MSPNTARREAWKYTTNLNGLCVHQGGEGTLFVPLPRSLWREIEDGCSCEFCRAVPGRKSYWDTLALSTERADHAWMVHRPQHGVFALGPEETAA